MIAPIESHDHAPRIRNLGVIEVMPDELGVVEACAGKRTLNATNRWVARHPTTAIVTSVAVGLLLGYFVKRRVR